MNPTDAILVAVLLIAAIRGAVRGFVAEFFGLLALVAGLAGGVLLAPWFELQLGGLEIGSPVREGAAFVCGFFAVYLGVFLVGLIVSRGGRRGFSGALNRLAGFGLGAAKWAAVLALLLAASETADVAALPGQDESRVAAALRETAKTPLRVCAGDGEPAAS